MSHTSGAHLAILGLVEDHRDSILGRVEKYVRLESPTSDGQSIDTLVTELEVRYQELGASVRLIPVLARLPKGISATAGRGTHIVASLAGAGELAGRDPVLLIGHSDTVWPRGTLSQLPWTVDGDQVSGPGSFDMKGGLVVIETAISIVRELNLPHPPLRVAIAADEEIGSPTFESILRELIEEAGCALGFESPHPDGDLKRGRWGSTRIEITVTGKESHAALDPDAGVSAIDELVDQIRKIQDIVSIANGDNIQRILVNVGTIIGGTRANVVAGSATALVGLRFLDQSVEKSTLYKIRQICPIRTGAHVLVKVLSSRPAWTPDGEHDELLDRMNSAAAAVGLKVHSRVASGAADTNLAGSLGLPTLDGLGPRGRGAHATDEGFSIQSLIHRVALLVSFLSSPIP